MSEDLLVSIVRGPPPTSKMPIHAHEIRALVKKRSDVIINIGESGVASARGVVISKPSPESDAPTLALIDGRLQSKNPDRQTLEWMLSLAADLDARVRGPDLRTYRTPTETYVHPDDKNALEVYSRRLAVAKNRWIPFQATVIKFGTIGLFVLFAVLLFWLGR